VGVRKSALRRFPGQLSTIMVNRGRLTLVDSLLFQQLRLKTEGTLHLNFRNLTMVLSSFNPSLETLMDLKRARWRAVDRPAMDRKTAQAGKTALESVVSLEDVVD
jgi:hypothetical protein